MSKEENVIKYYLICNILKDTIRTGWKKWNVKRKRIESVAEHIYGVQQLAIGIYYEYKYDLDLRKVILMLSVHELEETLIGDFTQFDISEEEKKKIGHEAIHKILNQTIKAKEIEDLILEFDERKTKEAVFAYHCDKLEADIQCKLYDQENTVDMQEQLSNPIFGEEKVKREIKNKENKTWSDMWLSYDKSKFTDDTNFEGLWKYIKNNELR